MFMPERASKSAGTWAAILVISPVILLAPVAVVSGRDDGDLVDLAERLGHGADNVGHVGDELVDDRGLRTTPDRPRP